MKKVLFGCLFVFILACCEKDYAKIEHCWDCYSMYNNTNVIIDSASYCGKTTEEIHLITEPEIIQGVSYRICYNKEWRQ